VRFQARMQSAILLTFAALLAAPAASGQGGISGLPAGARVIETRPLASKARPNRALILWMIRPKENPRDVSDDVYSCPEYTRGSYYSGPTRVSLIDRRGQKVINTVAIKPDYSGDGVEDSFDVPYRIQSGFYYHVEGARDGEEGEPVIMRLRDYNGDGKAFEFALFDALACMGLQTTLVGYDEARDAVVQYPVKLTTVAGRKRSVRISPWVDYLFSKSPDRPGHWDYEIDYRGRGGSLDKYDVRYDGRGARFEGTLVSRMGQ
jgi:hypothetical protein